MELNGELYSCPYLSGIMRLDAFEGLIGLNHVSLNPCSAQSLKEKRAVKAQLLPRPKP